MKRWFVTVSEDTDRALRALLGQEGAKKGDLSQFIEESVKKRIAEMTLHKVRKANANIPPDAVLADVTAMVRDMRAGRT